MDEKYVWDALRYVELNPVRASMAGRAQDWAWSSAAAHTGVVRWPGWLDGGAWRERFTFADWARFLGEPMDLEEEAAIRRATRENRPLASAEAIRHWEATYGVQLSPGQPGRPRKLIRIEDKQMTLFKMAG